jgi:hypothetical protein
MTQAELTEGYAALLNGVRAARQRANEVEGDFEEWERRDRYARQLEEDRDRALFELTKAHREAFFAKEGEG